MAERKCFYQIRGVKTNVITCNKRKFLTQNNKSFTSCSLLNCVLFSMNITIYKANTSSVQLQGRKMHKIDVLISRPVDILPGFYVHTAHCVQLILNSLQQLYNRIEQ